MKNASKVRTLLGFAGAIAISGGVFAAEREFTVPPSKPLEPATRYSGRTPVDLSNGIPFNNGTYGRPNPNYEKWVDSPLLVPGVSDLNYPYTDKAGFVNGLKESQYFVEDAIQNWKTTSAITKPEAKAYGENAANTMQPLLNRFKDMVKQTEGAGQNDWDKAQADARHALVEMRATYSSLHKNVR
jgi:hypothetical protein